MASHTASVQPFVDQLTDKRRNMRESRSQNQIAMIAMIHGSWGKPPGSVEEAQRDGKQSEEGHGYRTYGSRAVKEDASDLTASTIPTNVVYGGNEPGDSVDDSLKNNNATHPAMEEVISVETDLEPRNKRVVASSKDNQGHHVDECQRS
ncbi:hypothetical protein HG531_005321 [Fusarium graminearum]|nr:hypothetical protein HG531_005321 [Fusarium graminearum]